MGREGGSYTCFVCNQEHTCQRSPGPFELPVPPLEGVQDAAGVDGEQQQQQLETDAAGKGQQQDEEPPAKRARP